MATIMAMVTRATTARPRLAAQQPHAPRLLRVFLKETPDPLLSPTRSAQPAKAPCVGLQAGFEPKSKPLPHRFEGLTRRRASHLLAILSVFLVADDGGSSEFAHSRLVHHLLELAGEAPLSDFPIRPPDFGRPRRQFPRHLPGAPQGGRRGMDLVDQLEPQGALGVDRLAVRAEQGGGARADQTRQALGSTE